jgi:glucose/arabinose dehydrogenase
MRGRIIVGDVTPPPLPTPTPPGPTPDADELYAVRDHLAIERFASGFDLPVNLALASAPSTDGDPFLYVSELYKGIAAVSHEGTVSTYADGLLNYDPAADFPGTGENGVVGVAVEPGSGDVFASLVALANGELKDRVVRLVSSNDGRHAESQQVVLDGPPTDYSHQVQALSFGPDGKLYVNMGEAQQHAPAQDPSSLLGKVLRLNPDGSIPADNPAAGSAVYALGFRNPAGAAWSPDGRLYVTDNGPAGSGDRLLRVDSGGNYGWCCRFSQNALQLFDRSQGVGVMAVAFDDEHALSPQNERHLFVAFSGPTYARGVPPARGKWILDVQLDSEDHVVDVTELLHYQGGGFSTVAGMVVAPDGLYFTDLYGEAGFESGPPIGNIYRVFAPPGEPTATPTNAATPTPPAHTPTQTPTSITHVPADVNRSGHVDSVDAALVLQFSAGLFAELPAPENGDLNHDGYITAVDAAIILQYVAGLLDALPP